MKAFFAKIKDFIVNHKVMTSVVAVALVISILAGCLLPSLLTAKSSKLTRGVWASLSGAYFGFSDYQTEEPFYEDVEKADELFAAVQSLKERGILDYKDKFEENKRVTFGEMLTHVSKIYGVDYICRRLENEDATDSDIRAYVRKQSELSEAYKDNDVLNVEQATEWLTAIHQKYLAREFGNSFSADMKENVVDLWELTEYTVEGENLRLTSEKEIEAGDILLLGATEEAPSGLAYKVDQIQSQAGQSYELTVSVPELEEIFDEFDYEFSSYLQAGDFIPAEGITVIEEGTETASGDLTVSIDPTYFNDDPQILPLGNYNSIGQNITNVSIFDEHSFSHGISGTFFDKSISFSSNSVDTNGNRIFGTTPLTLNPDFPGGKSSNYTDSVADGVFLTENGKLKNKFDGGFGVECGLKLSNFKVSGSLNWRVLILASDFTANLSMDVTPYFVLQGNARESVCIGTIPCVLPYGFNAKVDINVVFSVNGDISVEPTIHCSSSVTKDEGTYLPRGTGSATCDTEVSVSGDVNVSVGPDVTLSWMNVANFADVYAYIGVGASTNYNTKKPDVITASFYLPTLHIGIGDNPKTLLSELRESFGADARKDFAIIDNADGALFRCPYTVTKEFSVMKAKKMEWEVKDGVLTITGTGRIPDYLTYTAVEQTLPPWYANPNPNEEEDPSVNTYIKKIVIEEGITYIGSGAFASLSGLESVEMPDSVVEIARDAFSGCENLKTVRFSNSLTIIGQDAFYDCSKLTDVTLPSSLLEIRKSAFQYCESLTGITIPAKVRSVGVLAFAGCTSLKDITIFSPDTVVEDSAFNYTAKYPRENYSIDYFADN